MRFYISYVQLLLKKKTTPGLSLRDYSSTTTLWSMAGLKALQNCSTMASFLILRLRLRLVNYRLSFKVLFSFVASKRVKNYQKMAKLQFYKQK